LLRIPAVTAVNRRVESDNCRGSSTRSGHLCSERLQRPVWQDVRAEYRQSARAPSSPRIGGRGPGRWGLIVGEPSPV
jgi:hypothetical protein